MRSRQQLAALLTQSANAIAIMGPSGQVCEWNPAAVALLGWTRPQMLAASAGLPTVDGPRFDQAWARLRAGEAVPSFATGLRDVNGATADLHLQLWAVLDGAEFDGVVAVMTPPTVPAGARDQAGRLRDHAGEERDEAGDVRDDAGVRRDLVGDQRDDVGERRDQAGEHRDRAGDRRDHDGGRRDSAGTVRDDEARARDARAAARDVTGTARDVLGAARDSEGRRRDERGDRRDAQAERRDRAAEHAEARRPWRLMGGHARRAVRTRRQAAEDRRRAAQDRGASALERDASCLDRGIACADREEGADQRNEAELDRRTASADRGAGAIDRDRARGDRWTANADRGAGASERSESEVDRTTAQADRGAGATEREEAHLDRDTALADRGASALDREQASVDELTGAHRREAGFVELEREISRARRTGESLVVVFADVDGLKQVNDTHGHAAGDTTLLTVGEALRRQLRSHDLVIRYGGDEFVCVIPGLSRADAAERLALVDRELAAGRPPVSITVGYAELEEADDCASLVGRADAELYARRVLRRGV